MARSICEALLDTLAETGAREIFGMTGDVINPLLEAIRKAERSVSLLSYIFEHDPRGFFVHFPPARSTGRFFSRWRPRRRPP